MPPRGCSYQRASVWRGGVRGDREQAPQDCSRPCVSRNTSPPEDNGGRRGLDVRLARLVRRRRTGRPGRFVSDPRLTTEGFHHATRGACSCCVRAVQPCRDGVLEPQSLRHLRHHAARHRLQSLWRHRSRAIGPKRTLSRMRRWPAGRHPWSCLRRRRCLWKLWTTRTPGWPVRTLRSAFARRTHRGNALHRAVRGTLWPDGSDRRLSLLHDSGAARLPQRQPAFDRSLIARTRSGWFQKQKNRVHSATSQDPVFVWTAMQRSAAAESISSRSAPRST